MNLLRRYFLKNEFVQNVITLSGGTAIAQAFMIGTTPLLTRLYTPVEFGVLALLTSLVAILLPFASFSYEMAIPLPKEDSTAYGLFRLALLMVVLASFLCLGLVHLFGRWIVEFLKVQEFLAFIWLVPLSFAAQGTHRVFEYWMIRHEAFRLIAISRIGMSVSMVLSQVIIGSLCTFPFGLLIGFCVGQIVGLLILIALFFWKGSPLAGKDAAVSVFDVARRYRRFPAFTSPAVLLGSLGSRLSNILIQLFQGAGVLGSFSLAERVVATPLAFVGHATGQVYYGKACRLAGTAPRELHRLYLKIAKHLALIACLPALLVGLGSQGLFKAVFGSGWGEAGLYAQLMIIPFVMQFIVSPISLFSVLERQDLALTWSIARLVIMGGSLLIGGVMAVRTITFVWIFSLSHFVSYALMGMLSYYAIRRKLKSEP